LIVAATARISERGEVLVKSPELEAGQSVTASAATASSPTVALEAGDGVGHRIAVSFKAYIVRFFATLLGSPLRLEPGRGVIARAGALKRVVSLDGFLAGTARYPTEY
jgi:hypothetical protein